MTKEHACARLIINSMHPCCMAAYVADQLTVLLSLSSHNEIAQTSLSLYFSSIMDSVKDSVKARFSGLPRSSVD